MSGLLAVCSVSTAIVQHGYQVDPAHPRDPRRVQLDAITSVMVQQIFAFYLEPQATLYQVAARLTAARVLTPSGKERWTTATIRNILTNPGYTGTAYANRMREVDARQRKSALGPLGRGKRYVRREAEDWEDVCSILTEPEHLPAALARAQACSGWWDGVRGSPAQLVAAPLVIFGSTCDAG